MADDDPSGSPLIAALERRIDALENASTPALRARRATYGSAIRSVPGNTNYPLRFNSIDTPWTEMPVDLTDNENPAAIESGVFVLNLMIYAYTDAVTPIDADVSLGVTFDSIGLVNAESQYVTWQQASHALGAGGNLVLSAAGHLPVGQAFQVYLYHNREAGAINVGGSFHVMFLPCEAQVLVP